MAGKALWQEWGNWSHDTHSQETEGECWYSALFLLLKSILNYLLIFICAHVCSSWIYVHGYSMYVKLRGHLIGISSLCVGSKEYKTARVSGKYLPKEPSHQSTLSFLFSLEPQTIGWYHLYSGWSLLSIQPSWKHFQSCFSMVIIIQLSW